MRSHVVWLVLSSLDGGECYENKDDWFWYDSKVKKFPRREAGSEVNSSTVSDSEDIRNCGHDSCYFRPTLKLSDSEKRPCITSRCTLHSALHADST